MANNQELLAMAIQSMELEEGFEKYEEAIFEAYEDGELLTFAEWKKRGYSVKKGQKSVFSCSLWKKLTKKEADESEVELDENGKPKKQAKFVLKKCCFFLPSQVEKIQVKKG